MEIPKQHGLMLEQIVALQKLTACPIAKEINTAYLMYKIWAGTCTNVIFNICLIYSLRCLIWINFIFITLNSPLYSILLLLMNQFSLPFLCSMSSFFITYKIQFVFPIFFWFWGQASGEAKSTYQGQHTWRKLYLHSGCQLSISCKLGGDFWA